MILPGCKKDRLCFADVPLQIVTEGGKDMSGTDRLFVILLFVTAGIMLLISIFSFMERGILLNNTYLYASKEEREKMDKKPYYRQTAIVFLLLFFVFVILGSSVVFHNGIINLFTIPFLAGVIIYALRSSEHIDTDRKNKDTAD